VNVENKNNSWLFVVVLLACFTISAGVRFQQFETWEKTPAVYFVGERPMMTTLDAPYWLRFAREYNEGTFGKETLREYPNNSEQFRTQSTSPKYTDPATFPPSSGTPEIKFSDVSLLSFLIAKLSPFFNYNYYLTGTLLIPTLASLFILPLGVFFFRIGVPVSGLLGGLIGTFSSGYYMRSSIGRIDTDMLNLFFLALTALMILLAMQSKSERSVVFYSMCSGLSLLLFQWWYSKEGFLTAFFAILVFSLFIQQVRFRTILLSAMLFVPLMKALGFTHSTNNMALSKMVRKRTC
jgi:dolichyl-diphosphooligosaccharide--protein glycosyltransferase